MKARQIRSLLLLVVLACGGCAYHVTEDFSFTLEHAFTDAAAARAREDADRNCERKRLVAVKTGGVCSLTRCTTHFQCMSKADAQNYQR